ncbi:MAG: Eco57I restriction-modification methylase domain-containing protein [Gemmatimonadales bacterium]
MVGRNREFAWYGVGAEGADTEARRLARLLATRGRLAGVLGVDATRRRLTLAVAFDGLPALTVELDRADPAHVVALERLRPVAGESTASYAARAAEALSGEGVGRRFFQAFQGTLDRMAADLRGPIPADDRQALALLQLTRVLFLYFIQAKGWLAGRYRFLAEEVDRCLSRRRRVHRDLLRPLFFGTLNRPADQRSRITSGFGSVPFLNGGLFEPHPLERRYRSDIGNELWRDAFDHLFERFHFTVTEGDGHAVAPDMLGRVFEGVMATSERRSSGTYYTPSNLVGSMLDSALVALVAGRLGCPEPEAEQRLADGAPEVRRLLRGVTLLDPAAGSGAFLLGALERLATVAGGGRSAVVRRRILERNLFGVDRNPAAVRLTELRLWLAVVASDPSEDPISVQPLPNLDCLIRQGDSLFDPVGTGLRPPPAAMAAELARLRGQVVVATGPDKRRLVHELAGLEATVAEQLLAELESSAERVLGEVLSQARELDLFGRARGLDRRLSAELSHCRAEAHRIRRLRRGVVRGGAVPWFHYQVQFADVFAAGGFDLVVGNPPWLRAEAMEPELRSRLAARYRWWRRAAGAWGSRPDLAVAFLERSVQLTRPGGIVAMLVPAKIARATYGAEARHALASGTTLIVLADLTGRSDAAFDATVYPLALLARHTRPPPRHRVRTRLALGGPTVRQARLAGGGPWILAGDRLQSCLAGLRAEHPALADVVRCQLGVKTGANRVFLDPPLPDGPLIRWAVRGRDLRGLTVRVLRRLLWTHGPDGAPLRALPAEVDAYLLRHRAALLRRVDHAGGPPWTLFRTRAATAPHRVVWADVARSLSAAALTGPVDARLVPLNSCYVAPTPDAATACRIAAWLNSTWLRGAARTGALPAAGGFARFTATLVGALPVPAAVLTDSRLDRLAREGRLGAPIQDDLDELAAEHLGLARRARTLLGRAAAERAAHRG